METLKELLESDDLINRTALARKMWPNVSAPNVKMSMKLTGQHVGNGAQRFTEDDEDKATKALKEHVRIVSSYINRKQKSKP